MENNNQQDKLKVFTYLKLGHDGNYRKIFISEDGKEYRYYGIAKDFQMNRLLMVDEDENKTAQELIDSIPYQKPKEKGE